MNRHAILKNLNPRQKEAVLHTKGPLLVLAGAGSGKTRVIAHRYAYLCTQPAVSPSSILCLTFSNKAAREMKDGVEKLLETGLKGAWIGTFHTLSGRILRKEIDKLGFRRDFVIYDEHDSHSLIRSILKEFKIHEALYKGIFSKMCSLKASMIGPEEFLTMTSKEDGYGFDDKFARVYLRYQDDLKSNNALDFDDLIMHTIRLFEEHGNILEKYEKEFPYIMIDEFQDTNLAQYRLSRLLAGKRKNICAVGDDDQSIYRFKGAEMRNIFTFEKDFSRAKVIRLEQNYRSTQNIIDMATRVISRNTARKPKKLICERDKGEKVLYCVTNNEVEEAKYIARSIKELYLKGKHTYGDFAVFYRAQFQSRIIEEVLAEEGISHRIIGGISFFQGKEIKDVMSYLKFITNPDDSVNLKRILNCPPRGIGAASIARIENEAKKKDMTLFETLRHISSGNGVATALREKIYAFVTTMEALIRHKNSDPQKLLWEILERTGYLEWTGEEKMEPLKEFITYAKGKDLTDFLDASSLSSSVDEQHEGNFVSLMTIHNAKGLEFPVVFIVGVEDGLLPHFHTLKSSDELQEERRLFYVGMTRAKDLLVLSSVKKRKLYTSTQKQKPSRFLSEIPIESFHYIERKPKREAVIASVEIPASLQTSTPFFTGVRVKHPKWGVGVIRDCYGECDDPKVMVNFSSVGVKRLSLKFANLEKL